MDYLLGSLYVTRCYETLEALSDLTNNGNNNNNNNANNNNASSLNQSMQEDAFAAGGSLMNTMNSPLEESDLMDSPGNIFTARRSTAKPSRAETRANITPQTPSAAASAAAAVAAASRLSDAEELTDARVVSATSSNAKNTGSSNAAAAGSSTSGRTTPVAGATYASDLPASSESSPGRTSLPVLRNAAPVEYAVPVCELENKYVLLYLAPPTEAPRTTGNSGAANAHSPGSAALSDGMQAYGDASAGTGVASPETSTHDLFQLPSSRRPRQDAAPQNPISAVALWKTQQQQQQQQLFRSPYTPSTLATPGMPKAAGARGQSSPPRPTHGGIAGPLNSPAAIANAAGGPLRTRASRTGPLALPTEKLLLLFYGLLMQHMQERDLDSSVVSTAPHTRHAKGPESAPLSPNAAADRGLSMMDAMRGVAARVDAPVAVLELQYVPLAGGTTDDSALGLDDTQLGATTGSGLNTRAAGGHASQSTLSLSPSATATGGMTPSASTVGLRTGTTSALSVPRSQSQTVSPNGQGSPLLAPVRAGTAFKPTSPMPAFLGSTAAQASGAGGGSGSGARPFSATTTSAAGSPRGASVATASPSSGTAAAQRGPINAPVNAKPLSEVVNMVLDGQSVDLDQVYFDRAMLDNCFYGGWFALRNGDAYRRVIDIYGITSWPTVLLLDPDGNVVSFQALEHVERELGHYYYARYLKRRPQPPPPLMVTAPSEGATTPATAGADVMSPGGASVSPVVLPVALMPSPTRAATAPVIGSGGVGAAAGIDSDGSFGAPTSPLSVDDEDPKRAKRTAPHHRSTTGSGQDMLQRHGNDDDKDAVNIGDADSVGEVEGPPKSMSLSKTVSPIRRERGVKDHDGHDADDDRVDHPHTDSGDSHSTDDASENWSSPASLPATTTTGPNLGTPLHRTATKPGTITNETQVFSSPLEPGKPAETAEAAAASTAEVTGNADPHSEPISDHSHSDVHESSSFTSGTLLTAGTAADAADTASGAPATVSDVPALSTKHDSPLSDAVTQPASALAGTPIDRSDTRRSSTATTPPRLESARAAVDSFPPDPALSTDAPRGSPAMQESLKGDPVAALRESRQSLEGWPGGLLSNRSSQYLEASNSADMAGAAGLSAAGGEGVSPLTQTVGIPSTLRAQATASSSAAAAHPAVRFYSAFPWCPTRPISGFTAPDDDDDEEDNAKDVDGEAPRDATSSSADAAADSAAAPSRPSLHPLLMRALALARPAADVGNAETDVSAVLDAAVGAEPNAAAVGDDVTHLVVVFGARWHPAVPRLLKSVEKLVNSVNDRHRGGQEINMDADELDGEGLFPGVLGGGGLGGGRGFFMPGSNGIGSDDGDGFGNGLISSSLHELETKHDDNGGLPNTLTGLLPPHGEPPLDDAAAAAHTHDDDDDGNESHSSSASSPGVPTHAHVLYVCVDDTVEELRHSARVVPGWWSCLSPSLSGNAATHTPTVSGANPSETSVSASYSRVDSDGAPLPGATVKSARPFSTPSSPQRQGQPHYGGTSSVTSTGWAHMSAGEVSTWLLGSFNVTSIPRVIVLQRFPAPNGNNNNNTKKNDDVEDEDNKNNSDASVWLPVQLHAESSHLFSDPTGTEFPWTDPNVLFSGDVVGAEINNNITITNQNQDETLGGTTNAKSGELADDEGEGGFSVNWSPERRSLLSPYSSVRFGTSCSGTHFETNVNRLMKWYTAAPSPSLASTYGGMGMGTGAGAVEGDEQLASTATQRQLGAHSRTANRGNVADADAGDDDNGSAEAGAQGGDGVVDILDGTRYVVPPIAPFALAVPKAVALVPSASRQQEGGVVDDQTEPMYPTEENSMIAPSAAMRGIATPVGSSRETVTVPSELPVRVRRGGFFLVLCAFGPVESSLHQECLHALQEARRWLCDVLSERKRKAWEMAHRSRDMLALTLTARLANTLTGVESSQFSPRGGAMAWMPTLTNAATIPGLASFMSADDTRMGASPPAFASVPSERSLNSTYVLNDVQRALQQQAPAEYDGERGVASSNTTLPLVYFYDAVYPNPRAHAAAGTGNGPAGRHQTPDVTHDHTRAAREAHTDDLAFLQEHILSNVLEQDESQLPPREGEIFLTCVRLPQKFAAVLRRRLPSEMPPSPPAATTTTTTTTTTSTSASTAVPAAATGAGPAQSASPPANVTSAAAGVGEPSPRLSVSTGRAGSQSSASAPQASATAATSSTVSGSNPRHASPSLEGTEMGVEGGHSGSPSLANTLRKESSPDPDIHPVASVAAVKQFLFEQIVEGLQDA